MGSKVTIGAIAVAAAATTTAALLAGGFPAGQHTATAARNAVLTANPASRPAALTGIVSGSVMALAAQASNDPAAIALPIAVKVQGRAANGAPLIDDTTPAGYSPAQLQAYLSLKGTGAGQTVAIVDAFKDSTIRSDVTAYSKQFGLPALCGKTSPAGCFNLTVVAPNGTAGTDPDWGLETSLDVEMVHAIAPQAAVTLVEAHDSSIAGLFSALDYAGRLRTAVISNSWGLSAAEFTEELSYNHHCILTTSVCVFSTGDNGNPGEYPATSPDVVAVGGTTLTLGAGGTVTSEIAWGCPGCQTGSGGGISYVQPRPVYQATVNSAPYRGIPDVSFDADPSTGVAVYDSDGITPGWIEVGGTSVGAPSWSAILAATDQLRAAIGKPPLTESHFAAQAAIYGLRTGLADITHGETGFPRSSSTVEGVSCGLQCVATTGYDYVTGLGSPRPGIDQALAAAG